MWRWRDIPFSRHIRTNIWHTKSCRILERLGKRGRTDALFAAAALYIIFRRRFSVTFRANAPRRMAKLNGLVALARSRKYGAKSVLSLQKSYKFVKWD